MRYLPLAVFYVGGGLGSHPSENGLQGVRIDWVAAKAALLAHDGIPVIVGTRSEAEKVF